MLTEGERAQHAARVSSAAEIALAGLETVGAPPDMCALAELLGAIGKAWASQARYPVDLAEAYRWSEVCILAERIAARWLGEMRELVVKPEPVGGAQVFAFPDPHRIT